MHYLSEDPWPLVYMLGAAALAGLVALRVTQQGKYLVWCGVAVLLALVVLLIEHFWVTDNERIEAVVYDIARSVAKSDAEGVIAHLAPDARVELGSANDRFTSLVTSQLHGVVGRALTREMIRAELVKYHFDFVRITRLHAEAGAHTRRGTAEFRVQVFGVQHQPFHTISTPPAGMGWSLGFREVEPGVWKVTRITPGEWPQEGG